LSFLIGTTAGPKTTSPICRLASVTTSATYREYLYAKIALMSVDGRKVISVFYQIFRVRLAEVESHEYFRFVNVVNARVV